MHLAFQPFRLQPPVVPYHRFITLPLSLIGFLLFFLSSLKRSGLRHSLEGSPLQQAESSLLTYGLAFHLPLLPTTPHGVAVTVGYRAESVFPERDFHPSGIVHFQAHQRWYFQPLRYSILQGTPSPAHPTILHHAPITVRFAIFHP
ncbi:MAG: hypothetical protein UZ01_00817 [Candidatus Brocadia sinica]|nr:MAG: hypothetical protein UZ01_00817 [Candidatus Brocadia sinica]